MSYSTSSRSRHSIDRDRNTNGFNRHHESKYNKNREEDFFEKRRKERELIGMTECPQIWGQSPVREE